MANPVYAWNPFQERLDCHIPAETIKTAQENTRKEFVPRAAPFYSRNFILRRKGSGAALVLGVDYAFAHPFKRFTNKYYRNCYGSVILLKDFTNEILEIEYDTIGGPFILDEVAFATLVANIANSPRIVDWSNLVNVPTEWPADPHEHPASQTYDYLEMMDSLTALIAVMTDTSSTMNALTLLEEHMQAPLLEAHAGSKADLGLPDVGNLRPSVSADLAGSSANVQLTMNTFKEGLRMLRDGTLKLD